MSAATPTRTGRSLVTPSGLRRSLFAQVAVLLAKDESGYLSVGQQWPTGGTSLYGNHWVDRPLLLITIFKIAADLGGAVPLRLIGIGAGAGMAVILRVRCAPRRI